MIHIKIIKFEDVEYPDCLRKIKKPPKQLYILGDEGLLKGLNFAIIGSRNCTEYGVRQTKRFAHDLTLGRFKYCKWNGKRN